MVPNLDPKYKQKHKEVLDALILPLIIILVGVGAFGLGRLSALESQKGHLIIHPPGEVASSTLQ